MIDLEVIAKILWITGYTARNNVLFNVTTASDREKQEKFLERSNNPVVGDWVIEVSKFNKAGFLDSVGVLQSFDRSNANYTILAIDRNQVEWENARFVAIGFNADEL